MASGGAEAAAAPEVVSSTNDAKAAAVGKIIAVMKGIKLPGLPGKKTKGDGASAAAAAPAATVVVATTSSAADDGSQQAGGAACTAAAAAAVTEASSAELADVTAAATLHEVAGIITSMAKDHLGSLLVHPGHATVGVYYLAKAHQMTKLADHIDGSNVNDKELVQELIRCVDISDSIYPDRYPELVQKEQVVKESDIIFFYTQVHKLQPGFYLALDHDSKTLMWVIRGTHDIHDLLTDLCGVATPLPQPTYPEGSVAHWGMWKATAWLLDNHWERVLGYLKEHPGYNLKIIGHSMGGGVGALLALRLHTEEAFMQQLAGIDVTCLGVASAACLSGNLASEVTPYVTTLVMRYDLVPRFSAGQVVALQQELLEVDYKGLLHEDLLQHEIYRKAFERSAAVASQLSNSRKVQAAAGAVAAAAAATQAKAMAASGVLSHHIDRALAKAEGGTGAAGGTGEDGTAGSGGVKGVAAVLQHDKVKQAATWVSTTLKEVAAGGNNAAAAPSGTISTTTAAVAEFGTTTGSSEVAAVAAAATMVSSTDAASADAAASCSVVDAATASDAANGAGAGAGGATGAGAAAGDGGLPQQSFDDAGEAGEAAEAAAAGSILDVTLYAPGRLLYVKPVSEEVEEDQQHFELLDGKGDQRFTRIVLRTTCMSDHFPVAYKAGLTDVLEQMNLREQ